MPSKFNKNDRVESTGSVGLHAKGVRGEVRKVEFRGGQWVYHVHFDGEPRDRTWEKNAGQIKKV